MQHLISFLPAEHYVSDNPCCFQYLLPCAR